MSQPSRTAKDAAPENAGPGDSWLFIPALLFLVLTVAIAILLPCVVALQMHRLAALVAMLFFFPLPTAGYAYLWRFGYLEWPRSGPVPPRRQ